ncbi:carboxypeptidase-like regulatory domain-containing protein [Streptomyces sp. 6N223]|uniref:carboxypeptidase-like regulatory domain-containing protein n=1 Tax=Streptomyces sp. 6N223 TaxID=3457412 RepID=UPI003FD4A00A
MTDSLSHDRGGDAAEAQTAQAAAEEGTDALTIRGMVRDSLGVALPRALVTLTATEGGRRLAKTRSAADGAFSVIAPRLGDYLLSAFSPQLGTQSVTVRLTGRPVEVEFRMDVPGSVTT